MYYFEKAVAKCINTTAPVELSIASASISAILLVVTVPTNFLVCLAIIVDPNRKLRTQFNCFTFNLSLADLIVGCLAEPASIYGHITEAMESEHGHKLSSVVLGILHIPFFISAMASVLSIAALACERYLAIRTPFRYRKYFDVRKALIISVLLWIIAVSFGMLALMFNYILDSFIFFNSGVLLTGVLVCFASCRIRASLKNSSIQWQQKGIPPEKDILMQAKLTKTLALMIGTFMFCYVPACSMVFYLNFCISCNCVLVQWFRDAPLWLVLLNSAIDPYVYAVRSGTFRDAIYKILKCRRRERNKPRLFPSLLKYSRPQKNQGRTNYGAVPNPNTN